MIKSKTMVPTAFAKNWIKIYGPPEKIFSDNRGEFIGEELYDLCAAYGIKQDTTAAYLAFSDEM